MSKTGNQHSGYASKALEIAKKAAVKESYQLKGNNVQVKFSVNEGLNSSKTITVKR